MTQASIAEREPHNALAAKSRVAMSQLRALGYGAAQPAAADAAAPAANMHCGGAALPAAGLTGGTETMAAPQEDEDVATSAVPQSGKRKRACQAKPRNGHHGCKWVRARAAQVAGSLDPVAAGADGAPGSRSCGEQSPGLPAWNARRAHTPRVKRVRGLLASLPTCQTVRNCAATAHIRCPAMPFGR